METKITWNKKLSFTGINEDGFTVPLDAEPSVGGEENGFEPMELIAIGLAGCTAMDTISILQKKRQAITDVEIQVTGHQPDDYPKPYHTVEVKYIVKGGDIDPQAVERAIELSVAKYCIVSQTLQQEVALKTSFEIKAKPV